MSGKQLVPAAPVSAVALHDYARTSTYRSESKDLDIGHDTAAVLRLEDTSPSTRKVSVDSLGTAISSKAMSKREPLPMKLRALPRSFWEQPNTNHSPSPGYLFAPLPPLTREETIPEGADSNSGNVNHSLNSASSSANGLEFLPSANSNRGGGIVSPADTDLLFSLFHAVEKYEPLKKVTAARRGRPRRGGGSQHQQRQIRDEDPCLVSSVTEQLLPTLSGSRTTNPPVLRTVSLRAGSGSGAGPETLVSGGGTIALPCLQVTASYSQILSELVVKL